MKKSVSFTLLLGLCTLYGQNCQAHSHTTYIVEQPVCVVTEVPGPVPYATVESAPPAEEEEVMGVSPGVNYVWAKGHWQWDGNRWVRIHGRWVAKPHAAAVWVAGYWTDHHHHWKWTEGHWE